MFRPTKARSARSALGFVRTRLAGVVGAIVVVGGSVAACASSGSDSPGFTAKDSGGDDTAQTNNGDDLDAQPLPVTDSSPPPPVDSGRRTDAGKVVSTKDAAVPDASRPKDASAGDASGTNDAGATCSETQSVCETADDCCDFDAICSTIGALSDTACCKANSAGCVADDDCCGEYVCTNGTCTAPDSCVDLQFPCNAPSDCCAPNLDCAPVGGLDQSWCCVPAGSTWPCSSSNDCCGDAICDLDSHTCN